MDTLDMPTVRLRVVEESDAQFIVNLRLDPTLTRHLSPIPADVGKQIEWIQRYKVREQKGSEYYFVIESYSGEHYGTVRIYDFRQDSFSWGSWILIRHSPIFAALESMLAVYDFGFGPLGFQQSHFDVRQDNLKVIRLHERFGASRVREDELNVYFAFIKQDYLEVRPKYSKFLQSKGTDIA